MKCPSRSSRFESRRHHPGLQVPRVCLAAPHEPPEELEEGEEQRGAQRREREPQEAQHREHLPEETRKLHGKSIENLWKMMEKQMKINENQ